MRVLFSAPQLEFQLIRDEWFQAVGDYAKRGVFVGGPAVRDFESAFSEYCDVYGTVGVGNGTDALFLGLKALNIGPGDEVITVANTFIATVEAIHQTGATPVLVDCDPSSYLINLEQVKNSVTPHTKAIIPVHLYGQLVDLDSLIPWAEDRGIAVIEDSAQAVGAKLHNKAAGSMGTMGCFSFYPDKNLGALGDGGAIVSSSEDLLDILRKLRNHGGTDRYQHELPGFNSRLDVIQAKALEIKLRFLSEWNKHRRKLARLYEHYLKDIESIIVPAHRNDESHVFHLYVVRVTEGNRDQLKKHLQKKGILTAIQYPTPIHLTPAFAHLGYKSGSFQYTEMYASQIISLPIHIGMDEEAVASITDEIRNWAGIMV